MANYYYGPGGGSGGGGGGGNWTPQGATAVTVGGIAAGTNLGVVPTPISGTLTSMFYPYLGPLVSLVLNPVAGLREFGNTVAAPDLTPTTTRRSNNITTLTLSRSGVGVIHTYGAPNPAGGAEPPYTDVSGAVTTTTTYTATVGDGTSTSTGTGTYTFIYPYYYGSDAPALTGAQIRSQLTTLVATQASRTLAFSPTAEVYYYAYPAAYANLTSIIDQNGFNITADWTLRNPVVITGLDGTPQNYKVYEFNNLTSLAQNITFNL